MKSRMRVASALALTRGRGAELEVFLAERSPKLRFFGGYWAFPGGVVEDRDDTGAGFDETLRACARRELEEEVALSLDPSRCADLCSITTPPFAPVRYDTRFFHVELAPEEAPVPSCGELVDGRFFKPSDVLASWRRGELLIVPPVLLMLELLEDGDVDAFPSRARRETDALEQGKLHPVRFSPGVFMAPLVTATKPPATTTNCLLVGEEKLFVVDPGPPAAAEQARLFAKLDECVAAGSKLAGVVLTHHHPDHVGAVPAIQERYGLTVFAHPETLGRLPKLASSQPLSDGDELDLGRAPDGSDSWVLRAIHTPGHARGHLAFRESRYGALLAGDLCSTVSTIVIDPPEGHMATYLASLRRILDEDITTLYPGHGPAHRSGPALVRHYLGHRQQRENLLFEAVTQEPQSLGELVAAVYSDTDSSLHHLAERSLLASLIKLEEEGRVKSHAEGGAWSLV